ncbi:MAG: DUF3298 domain-containing protein, partial [Arenimonas sp.]
MNKVSLNRKAVLLLLFAAGPVSAASFDCAKAKNPQEKLICASPEVSRLDAMMATSYEALLQRLSPDAQNDLRRSQREWLAFWPTSCREEGRPLSPRSKNAQDCAAARYKDRIALFEGPDSVTGDIVLYPVSSYTIRPSDAGVERIKYAQTVISYHAVDLGQAAHEKKNLAALIDRWLRKDMGAAGDGDAGSDSETAKRFIISLPMLLSTGTTSYFYGHGAVHPVSGYSTQHFLLSNARPMLATDIFRGAQWQDGLTSMVEARLMKELGDFYYIETSQELKKLVINPSHWQFNAKELTISFNPYEVAPYAAGAPSVNLPWSSLAPWLTA